LNKKPSPKAWLFVFLLAFSFRIELLKIKQFEQLFQLDAVVRRDALEDAGQGARLQGRVAWNDFVVFAVALGGNANV
jgi:hypothetical protein